MTTTRLTLATSSGLPFLVLAIHVATAMIALAAGFVAAAVRKGGRWHRWSGLTFVYAMIVTAIALMAVSAYEGKSIGGGIVVIYFALTAYTTVTPLRRAGRQTQIVLMAVAFALCVGEYMNAVTALGRPGRQIDGAPAGMMFFIATLLLLAAIGDLRIVRAGALQGTRRVARHLWRMCFCLFIASGSFFLGQTKFIPKPLRSFPLLLTLAVSPLVMLVYWMWRVRLRHNLRGMVTRRSAETFPPLAPARTV